MSISESRIKSNCLFLSLVQFRKTITKLFFNFIPDKNNFCQVKEKLNFKSKSDFWPLIDVILTNFLFQKKDLIIENKIKKKVRI